MALTCSLALSMPFGTFAQDASELGEPAITIKTNAYATLGEANSFSILIGVNGENEFYDVDMGFGIEEFEATFSNLDSEGNWSGSLLHARVSEKGEIKIYGDATKIDVIQASGCYITEIDLSKCVNLNILYLEHNELKGLDLTPNTNLQAIYLSDNPGSQETPIIIGAPKPDLQILEVDIIDWLDPGFTPDYPKLKVLDCYATKKLDKLDLSGCPGLLSLAVELTAVEHLDLTPVPDMLHLNIAESRIREIDLSKVPKLSEFFCDHSSGTVNTDVKITSLDLSHNPELTYLAAADNKLTSLDLSKNPKVKTLYIRYNDLPSLDISGNNAIGSLDITGNRFTYSTLPADRTTFNEYFYSQKPYVVSRSLAAEAPIDFTSMLREGSNTYVRVMSIPLGAEPGEVDVDSYTWADGKLTFHKTFADSVYVEFANSELSDYTLTSTPFMVKATDQIGLPSRIVSMMVLKNSAVSFKVGVYGATTESPRKLMVDFGDGELKEIIVDSPEASTVVSGTSAGYNMYIYLPEGEVLSALDLDGQRLLSLDVKGATELQSLSASGCGLSSVNLANNRCLRSLNLSGNSLSTLDLTGVGGDYEKNFLSRIEAADNKITTFKLINTIGCEYLDLSNNLIAEYDLKNYDNIRHLDLSGNKLEAVNMAYLANAEYLDFSGNAITELSGVTEMPFLAHFDLSGNKLTLATLPYFENAPAEYVYAPQSKILIASKAPSVALADQNIVKGGNTTSFRWVKSDGSVLTEGTDYTMKDGFTRFLTIDGVPVHCEIANDAFPAFAGENVLSTTDVTPMGAPTTVIASFTVTSVAEGATIGFRTKDVSNVYVDWTGEGIDFKDYPTTTGNAPFIASTDIHAVVGKKALLYTYDTPSDITVLSVDGIGMSDFDGSSLTNLTMLGLYGTGLAPESVKFPEKTSMKELSIDESGFTSLDLSEFPALQSLVFTGSMVEEMDLSKAPKLQTAVLGRNKLTSVKLDNPELWGLDLTSNNLSSIDVSATPRLEQLLLISNNFSEIDLSPLKSVLKALVLVGNRFTFASLPRKADFPSMGEAFYYGNQAPVEASLVGDKIDLSSQARVGDTETVYTWYLGEISVDPDTNEIVGEKLVAEGDESGDEPEYSIKDGVTTFFVNYTDPVICVMTNTVYPNLVLYTDYIDISSVSGIDDIFSDGSLDPDAPVSVYSLQGILLRENVRRADATVGLTPGIYLVGGRKVAVK